MSIDRAHDLARHLLVLGALALCAGACGEDPAGARGTLRIVLTQSADGASSVQAATFDPLPESGAELGTVLRDDGSCALYGWFPSSGLPAELSPGRLADGDAGRITVQSGALELALDHQTEPERGYVTLGRLAEEGPLWTAGAPVQVAASGGADHDAFALALQAPASPTEVTLPAIAPAAELVVAWSSAQDAQAGDTAELTLWRTEVDPLGRLLTLRCTFSDEGDGRQSASGTVSAALIGVFADGAAEGERVHAWLVRSRSARTDEALVRLDAWAEPLETVIASE